VSERYRQGVDIVHRLAPDTFEQFCTGHIAEIAPDFARMVVEFAFGDLYARKTLDLRTREIIAIAALASLGHARQLRQHVAAAIAQGVSRSEVIEILMQSAIYGGFPNALNALADCHDLLAEGDSVAGRSCHP
jgi:4-carboxymuconolactone decarboxylase